MNKSDGSQTIDEIKQKLGSNPVEMVMAKYGPPVQWKKQGHDKACCCAFHDDQSPSLTVYANGTKWKCFVCDIGGDSIDLVARLKGITNKEAIQLLVSDLDIGVKRKESKVVGTYIYCDKDENPLYRVLRYEPGFSANKSKTFVQQRYDSQSKQWIGGEGCMKNVVPVPYRLPDILAAMSKGDTVFLAEGERNVEDLCNIGLTATTNHGGAKKWTQVHSQYFTNGSNVVVLPDNDKTGSEHAEMVAQQLLARNCNVKIVILPGLREKGDVSDFLKTHTRAEFLQLVDAAPFAEQDGKAPIGAKSDSPGKYDKNDAGNAQRLISLFGANMRYCFENHKWYVWTGRHWTVDKSGEVYRLAKQTAKTIYREAAQTIDDEEAKALVKHANRSLSATGIKNMLELAKSEPGIAVLADDFDRDLWKLNCLSGVIDLKTGDLLPHDPKLLITKIVNVVYDLQSDCPTFNAFLAKVMNGNNEMIWFLQKAIGYCLTGSTKEQCLFFCYGSGRNGKSTFLNVISKLLNNYAMSTQIDTLLVKQMDSGISNDLARLRGARFVSSTEAEEGKRLAESKIKQLTGEDGIAARFLYGELFEYIPTFKLFIGTNHKPVIRGSDFAIWRRIRLVPFDVTIRDDEVDRDLPEKLLDELPGILLWAVEGCLAWQREGLEAPVEVKRATEGYRTEMDILAGFLEDCCIVEITLSESSNKLYAAYTQWCADSGETPILARTFGARLKERGFEPTRIGHQQTRGYKGLSLNADTADAADTVSSKVHHEKELFSILPKTASIASADDYVSASDEIAFAEKMFGGKAVKM